VKSSLRSSGATPAPATVRKRLRQELTPPAKPQPRQAIRRVAARVRSAALFARLSANSRAARILLSLPTQATGSNSHHHLGKDGAGPCAGFSRSSCLMVRYYRTAYQSRIRSCRTFRFIVACRCAPSHGKRALEGFLPINALAPVQTGHPFILIVISMAPWCNSVRVPILPVSMFSTT
jgi:hypothetical protein